MRSSTRGWRRYSKPVAITALATILVVGLLVVAVGPQRAGGVVSSFNRLVQMRAASLASFYRPSSNVDAGTVAQVNDFIVLNEGDEPYRDQVRGSGYGGVILQYVLMMEAHGPGPDTPACQPEVKPANNTAADDVGDFCQLSEDMFLHGAAGQRLFYTQGSGTRYYYLMNPGSVAWQNLWLARMKHDADTLGYDGIFLDNLDINIAKNRWTNWDGSVQEYPGHENDATPYKNAVRDFLARIKGEIGKPVWANMIASDHSGSDWDVFLPFLDGGMNEAFAVGYPPAYRRQSDWEGDATQAESAQAQGKGFLAVSQGTQEDVERMRFSLATWFLIDQGNAHFRYASSKTYRELWDYPELHVDLGEPLGPRYKEGDTVWRRDFSCGTVRVDPTVPGYEFTPDESLPTCQR